jgi:peptidoglycan DL-endopeptidase CwlO
VERVSKAKAKLDSTRARLSERLVQQARGAERLDAKRAEAERLAAEIERQLRTMDRRVAALIEQERRREEASQRAAFADYLAAARTAGAAPATDGRASSAAARAVEVALAQLGSPYVWGAEGPSTFDCSGLTSFAYNAAGVTIPRVSRAQFAAYARTRPVDPMHLRPGDLVFFADNPGNPSTIHHVGMYIGKGLMVEAPYTGATVRTSSIWRPSYAGAVRPAP